MVIYEKYTTAQKVSEKFEDSKNAKAEEVEAFSKIYEAEVKKVVLSNDGFAQAELLELLINTMRNK